MLKSVVSGVNDYMCLNVCKRSGGLEPGIAVCSTNAPELIIRNRVTIVTTCHLLRHERKRVAQRQRRYADSRIRYINCFSATNHHYETQPTPSPCAPDVPEFWLGRPELNDVEDTHLPAWAVVDGESWCPRRCPIPPLPTLTDVGRRGAKLKTCRPSVVMLQVVFPPRQRVPSCRM